MPFAGRVVSDIGAKAAGYMANPALRREGAGRAAPPRDRRAAVAWPPSRDARFVTTLRPQARPIRNRDG
ncbi:hypothetical protein DK427_15760 [Methylobacterium radiodurans]|uniref:Uncharacterized protein n=1 Tax=Methylobacterium radiodurans TaxID=2202828 RepID=A0A2U8VUD9_9HYPH|nr:hypothetical protein DK427_15760 [Methylobacterium radiodurans]